MALKTDYKDYEFQQGETLRRYRMIENDDGTISLEDVTQYEVIGDDYSANDANATNVEVNKNAENIETALNNLYRPNLLINGDFQINQRGQTIYSTKSGRVSANDMWYVAVYATGSASFDFSTKEVSLSESGEISQNTDIPYDEYKDLTLVISAKKNGEYARYSVTYKDVPSQLKDVTVITHDIDEIGVTVHFYKYKEKIKIALRSLNLGTTSFTLEYIDLFEGSIAYPHIKEDYAIALARCQEWIVKIEGKQNMCVGFGQFIDKTNAYITFIIPSTLKNTPTMIADGRCLLCSKGSQNVPISQNIVGITTGCVFVIFTITEQMPSRELTGFTNVTKDFSVLFTCEPK